MYPLIALALSFQAHKTPPPTWLSKPMASSLSSEWQKQRKDAEIAVRALNQSPPQMQAAKIDALVDQIHIPRGTEPQTAYRAAYYFIYLRNEDMQDKIYAYAQHALISTRGSSDPEFIRVGYICLALTSSSEERSMVARKLLSWFPSDRELREAYISDHVHGQGEARNDYLHALYLVEDDRKAGMDKLKVIYRKANIRSSLFFVEKKKNKADLQIALSLYREALTIDKDPKRRQKTTEWIEWLSTYL